MHITSSLIKSILNINCSVFSRAVVKQLMLFKWKYFLVKSHIFSQDLELSGILIGRYSGHMT